MFVDEITLKISAGSGGDGIVSWMHEKGKEYAGPGGGDGGRGGNVYLKGTPDLSRLAEYRFHKDFAAEKGQNGKSGEMHGAAGRDLILELPIGSVVKNIETGKTVEILHAEPALFLSGGRGGYGNAHFKSSKNINPMQSTPGKPGEEGEFFIELKLVADVGLVGLPNAGKSTLLNALTAAKAKVGNYAFTTLNPNLGEMFGFIIADIPGLIEGASEGRGLGYKFLRHVSRTKMILYCISCEEENPKKVYDTVKNELKQYDPELLKKPEAILLTKADMVDEKILKSHLKLFKNKKVFTVSVLDDASVKVFRDELVKILKML